MHPRDCPDWEYDGHPRRQALATRIARLLRDLRRGWLDSRACASDSRSVHDFLFRDLAPAGHSYYAGHYRGEDYRCLKYHAVGVQNDPRVGFPPASVPGYMAEFATTIAAGLHALDLARDIPDAHVTREQKLQYVVAFACRVFETFLRIHPYVNGNGHAARFIIWAILGRYGYWPERWVIEPRPPDPPYTYLIRQYRAGNPQPLEEYILKALA